MVHTFIQLPEEILLIILKKMNNLNVLYSLFGINERIHAIVSDQEFTKHLSFKLPFISSSYPITDTVLDRFVHEILPNINDKIERLDVDSSIMDRIIYTTYYRNLKTLGLYNVSTNIASNIFCSRIFYFQLMFFYFYVYLDNSRFLIHFDKIPSLIIELNDNDETHTSSVQEQYVAIFAQICSSLTQLKLLFFNSPRGYPLSFDDTPIELLSNLSELHIKLNSENDCIHLLNCDFDQLHSLNVIITSVSTVLVRDNKVNCSF